MLCDQASDEIFFIYQTTLHSPLVIFYNRIDRLSIPGVKINYGTPTLPTTPDGSSASHPMMTARSTQG